MKAKAVIYARCSKSEQHPENQRKELIALAERRGFEITHIYEENESAWKNGHQRELARLMLDASHGRFHILLVWALDRLSREGALRILSIVHRLKQHGVHVISYQEPWTDSPGDIGEILYAIAGWVARMESERRSERTRAGLERAKAQGKTLGRPAGSRDKRKRKRRVKIAHYAL